MSRIVGAILAGGRSVRFGSDKALAQIKGERLIDRVIAALRPQVDGLIICGRTMPGMICVPDRPTSDLGPLGGLNAALSYASNTGFDAVLAVPCDVPTLPSDLATRLAATGGAAIAATIPVIGHWPAALADLLDRHLAHGRDYSVRRWAAQVRAVEIAIDGIANINTAADLDAFERHNA